MHKVDIIIFVIFFTINLIIGIKARGKKQSFKDFAVGSKDFSTATLVATMVATWASGSMFFTIIEQTYSTGLYLMIPVLIGLPTGLLITGYVIAPRLKSFLTHVSMADAMGERYGKRVQFIIAICTVLVNIGFTAIQFKVISRILVSLFNVEGPTVVYITVIAAAIITFYSAFGGVRAVTFTDVIQFITFGTLLPVLALAIWNNCHASEQIISTIQSNTNFSLTHVFRGDNDFVTMLTLMCYFMMPDETPASFQRMAMAKGIKQIKSAITYGTIILVLIMLFMMWIALLLLSDNPNLETSELISYMIHTHTYVGLKGFLGIGIIALAMSTADSSLNAMSVLVANDILPTTGLTKKASVSAASIATFILGFFAILLALSIESILETLLIAENFGMPVVTVPCLLTIFGFKTTKRVILIGMAAGATITALLLILYQDVNSLFPGMFVNLIFLLGSHYLLKEKGGWVKH